MRRQVAANNLKASQAFWDLELGIIDYRELKKLLDEIGFDGIGVIEQDMATATTQEAFEAAKRNLKYLQDIKII